jgi:hypothetical protein
VRPAILLLRIKRTREDLYVVFVTLFLQGPQRVPIPCREEDGIIASPRPQGRHPQGKSIPLVADGMVIPLVDGERYLGPHERPPCAPMILRPWIITTTASIHPRAICRSAALYLLPKQVLWQMPRLPPLATSSASCG